MCTGFANLGTVSTSWRVWKEDAMPSQTSVWQPPTIRSVEPGHRQATWAELFFDLIFVVAVAQLAAFLLHNLTWRGVGIYVLGSAA